MAIIGSLVSSTYSNDVEGALGNLPPEAQAGATDSIGAAHAMAAHLPPDVANGVLATTGDAFARAMGVGLLLAAALAGLTAVVVARCLPARESAEPTREEAADAVHHLADRRVAEDTPASGRITAMRPLVHST